MAVPAPYVAVVGAGGEDVAGALLALAEQVGAQLARRGAVLVTGGLGGVMEAACRGARSGGGTALGILPGSDRADANAFVDVASRAAWASCANGLVIRSADAVIAIAGGHGTLSEIALALKAGKRVVGLQTWEIEGVVRASDAAEAVALALGADRS